MGTGNLPRNPLTAAIGQGHTRIQRHTHFNINNRTLALKTTEKPSVHLQGLCPTIPKHNPNPCAAQMFQPLTRRAGIGIL
jgi:hypothetical protein